MVTEAATLDRRTVAIVSSTSASHTVGWRSIAVLSAAAPACGAAAFAFRLCLALALACSGASTSSASDSVSARGRLVAAAHLVAAESMAIAAFSG